MKEDLIKITPDKEKVKSIMRMVETTMEMVKGVDRSRFPSNVAKEYYEIIRELMSVILLLDGYKTAGEGAHKRLIEYIQSNCRQFTGQEIAVIDDLRVLRNRIAYDGFFVKEAYIDRKLDDIQKIIEKLRKIISEKLA